MLNSIKGLNLVMKMQRPLKNELRQFIKLISRNKVSNKIRMSSQLRITTCLIFLMLFFNSYAKGEPCTSSCTSSGAEITFSASIYTPGQTSVTINGTSSTGKGKCPVDWIDTNEATTTLLPNQEYKFTVTGSWSTKINFQVPSGYKMEIEKLERNQFEVGNKTHGSGNGTWTLVVRRSDCGCGGKKDERPGESDGIRLAEIEDIEAEMEEMSMKLSLGGLPEDEAGGDAGEIDFSDDNIDANTYSPSALRYVPPAGTNDVDVIRTANNILRQIKTPQTLVDIVVISSSEYEIRFYNPSNIGAKVDGLYQVSGQPFTTWKLKNPDPSTIGKLEVSNIENGRVETQAISYDAATGTWSLKEGTKTQTNTESFNSSTNEYTRTITVKNDKNEVLSHAVRVSKIFAWGEELIKETIDPEGANLVTTYDYYQDSTQKGKYGKVKSISYPNGYWVKYDYDSIGNISLAMRPWKDQAMASATESNSHTTHFTYTNFDGIVTMPYAKFPSSVEEKVEGKTIKKITYDRAKTTIGLELAVIETETVYASSSVSYKTITTRYYKTASPWLADKVAFLETSDGKLITNSYERGTFTPNSNPALSQFTPSDTGTATRETITFGTKTSPSGIAYKTMKVSTIYNDRGYKILEETFAYMGGTTYERIGWTNHEYNDVGQVIKTTGHDGREITNKWDGSRVISTMDEHGIEVTYTYDSLGRASTKTKKGIAANGSIPKQEDIVTTYTYDAEDRIVSEKITGGTLSLTSSIEFDKAGRIKSTTDTRGVKTAFTYENGGLKQTTAAPGGVTQTVEKHLNGQVKSISGTGVIARQYSYGVNSDGTRYTTEYVGASGTSSPRWGKVTIDWMSRTIKSEGPGFTGETIETTAEYNSKGQLFKQTTAKGGTKLISDKLYAYDDYGVLVRSGLDVDASGTLTDGSTDRFTEGETKFEKSGTDWYVTTISKAYLKDNDSTATTLGTHKARLTNFAVNGSEKTVEEIWDIDINGKTTTATKKIDRAAKKIIETVDTPHSSTDAVNTIINGLLQSSAPASVEQAMTFTYDALGRTFTSKSPKSGTTSSAFDAKTGQLVSVTDGVATTTFEYYPSDHQSAGLLKSEANSNGKKTYFNYNKIGALTQTWGDTTYPMEYVYDGYGQRTELKTYRGGSGWSGSTWPTSTGTADVTKWIYDEATGMLTQKQDAAGKGTSFKYDLMGRVSERKWARTTSTGAAITTTYTYDDKKGELTKIDYSDATPDVVFNSYDRIGRLLNVTDGDSTSAFTYHTSGGMASRQVTGGILNGVKVEAGYDGFGRRSSLQASLGTSVLHSQTYAPDTSGRLEKIVSNGITATYSYDQTRGLLQSTSYSGGISLSRSFDTNGRLEQIKTLATNGSTITGFTYAYNNLHQRTKVTREDGSYWAYAYNDRGELISSKKRWSDNTWVAGQQMEYGYDNIGNRTNTKSGGDAAGNNLQESTYAANSLNQYTQRSVPGVMDIFGNADSSATVTVNNQQTTRKGEYFHTSLPVNNQAGPVYEKVDAVGVKGGAGSSGEDAVLVQSGRKYVPAVQEQYVYDADGNLLQDGRWTYTWDAENRLTSMTALPIAPAEAKKKLEFTYDYSGRRIQKKVYGWNGAGYQIQSTTKFIYDGWNLIAELDGSNTIIRSYTWGMDLSGGFQGAGGIGGLLLIKEGSSLYQVGYDGNGNVSTLVKTGTNTVEAIYEYDAQGNQVRATGTYASRNPFRFSTKYIDVETELIYYGHRYYNSQTGRWVSKDPIGEAGGINLYGFVGNNSVSIVDRNGLDWWYNAKEAERTGKFKPVFYKKDPHGDFKRWTDHANYVYRSNTGKYWALHPRKDLAKYSYDEDVAKTQLQEWLDESTPFACLGAMTQSERDYEAGFAAAFDPIPFGLGASDNIAEWGGVDTTSRDYEWGERSGTLAAILLGGGAAIGKTVGNHLFSVRSDLLLDFTDGSFRQVSTGLRNDVPLTPDQADDAVAWAKYLGMPEDGIRVSESMNTGWRLLYGQEDLLYIGTDAYPRWKPVPGVANSRMSMRAGIAHEIEGHRAAALAGKTHPDDLLEEVQASIRAARFSPGLTSTERYTLLRDALERLRNNCKKIRDVKEELWINEPK
jgi:RHS repeat-associated protein